MQASGAPQRRTVAMPWDDDCVTPPSLLSELQRLACGQAGPAPPSQMRSESTWPPLPTGGTRPVAGPPAPPHTCAVRTTAQHELADRRSEQYRAYQLAQQSPEPAVPAAPGYWVCVRTMMMGQQHTVVAHPEWTVLNLNWGELHVLLSSDSQAARAARLPPAPWMPTHSGALLAACRALQQIVAAFAAGM